MKKIMLAFFFSMIFIQQLFSVDSTITNYYPLKIGNSWTYKYDISIFPYYERYWSKNIIIDTLTINNHSYYKLINTHDTIIVYIRFELSNGNLLKYSIPGCAWLNNEILLDSLASKINDYSSPNCFNTPPWRCNDTSFVNIFNYQTRSKNFILVNGFQIKNRKYAYGFGNISYSNVIQNSSQEYVMLGCVINGIVYGDTTLPLGISQIGSEIQNVFKLSQNYPNPFNPTTQIEFNIPKSSHTKLIIHDLLGREVTTLVNEELKPGTYEAEWDASNYSSGIYFYKLITNEFIETKKMVLIR